MLNQVQSDAAQFKLTDIAVNIGKYKKAGSDAGSAIEATYLDRTYSEFGRIMQKDQENDDAAVFLFEYQALLRSRMQQMITELTAALTRDLDKAMTTTRFDWDTETSTKRQSAQGYSNNLEDAGAARMAYNFFSGYAASVRAGGGGLTDPVSGVANGVPYLGLESYDSRAEMGNSSQKVPIDTTSDALFGHQTRGGTVRVTGTAVIQQSFPEDGLTEAVIDELNVVHRRTNASNAENVVLYNEVGGGFVAHKNNYKFIDTEGNAPTDAARYDARNIGYTNESMNILGTGAASLGDTRDNFGQSDSRGVNINDDDWDGDSDYRIYTGTNGAFDSTGPNDGFNGVYNDASDDIRPVATQYQRFNRSSNSKNEFQRVLYDTVFELDNRNLLRDIFRLSEKNGFFNDVQIASTTSLTTGSQIQASILLNYVPTSTGEILSTPAPTASSVTVANSAINFAVGDAVYVTVNGEKEIGVIAPSSDLANNIINFVSPLSGAPDVGTAIETTRPDLGGKIEILVDRFSAFYSS